MALFSLAQDKDITGQLSTTVQMLHFKINYFYPLMTKVIGVYCRKYIKFRNKERKDEITQNLTT